MGQSTLELVKLSRYWGYHCLVRPHLKISPFSAPSGRTFGRYPNHSVAGYIKCVLISLVVGYGIGPLFLAPITEIPQIGRNLPYIVPLAIFCILQVPTALVENFAGFCILRFIAGFVSSPPLATGGESGVPLSCFDLT